MNPNSNPLETLNLLADELEELLNKRLGEPTGYVLVFRNGDKCNCISNIPLEQGEEVRAILRELSDRPIVTQQGN